MKTVFTLKSSYEIISDKNDKYKLLRIEIYQKIDNSNFLRARIWEQNTYNLFPTALNLKSNGGLKNEMFSCDDVNREITLFIADEPFIIRGREYANEQIFLDHLYKLIDSYLEMFHE